MAVIGISMISSEKGHEYYWELREFPDQCSNFGLLYGRVYGPLMKKCTSSKTEMKSIILSYPLLLLKQILNIT